ncbi:hypothetical protein B0I35DRAFT_481428 [Stachybotrys elegans]|uniref:Carrier domain-containing protein n=1 Tax=Stachybotrys elegans TaxID=80388 RepID=A0A8K0WMU6_9HYPO|nr:hypothetical protein B0I35DRAFT_481428 [Stachybotrys elegans]
MAFSEPIAIIGSGCRFAGDATSPSKLWDLLRSPRDLSSTVPEDRFNAEGFYHDDARYHGHSNVDRSYFLAGDAAPRRFDASFFGVTTAEAKVLDPQIRMLLEVVYEALEDAGHPLRKLRGSDTAVYSGMTTTDYENLLNIDKDAMGIFHVTGASNALASNKLSQFFDWRGPSETINTACSSSLYAVHHAVQQLRSGRSRVAIATGSNLILDPSVYVRDTKSAHKLSPGGRSRMWDAEADGYARGEGVAAVVLKTLRAAEEDGDRIECVIRETAVGQEGRTRDAALPSADAQAHLIRTCYARAGLNLTKPSDRPHFIEANGVGSPTADPVEAEAISAAFFGAGQTPDSEANHLYVGSVKTVLGHTEATAGLASLIKVAQALRHSTIPPNLHFSGAVHPRVEPFYRGVMVPTVATPWPEVAEGSARRASVNSFGFGGANAHAILESYVPSSPRITVSSANFSPFIFSAATEASLVASLEKTSRYLKDKDSSLDLRDLDTLDLRDLAHTLGSRRTRFPLSVALAASSASALSSKIDQALSRAKTKKNGRVGTRALANSSSPKPSLLAIFTCPGAQWPRMGASLLAASPAARAVFDKLQARLDMLPASDRPEWSLLEELHKDTASFQTNDSVISGSLTTAIQILLVDMLRAAGVELTAMVGHSTGEIAAAYAAGVISAEDAMVIAYYRGFHSRNARGPKGDKGAMMVVATTLDDVEDRLSAPEFQGRASVAVINSPSGITISGDSDAIDELVAAFSADKKPNARLKADNAYHSSHMDSVADAYLASLRAQNIQVRNPVAETGASMSWFSAVTDDDVSYHMDSLPGQYWVANLQGQVRFMNAVQRANDYCGPFDLAVEIGPHAVLQRPTLDSIHAISGEGIPYAALMTRSQNDVEVFASGLGAIATQLGEGAVDLQAFETFMAGGGDSTLPEVLSGLPSYSWDHSAEHWHESRFTKAYRNRSGPVHELLGHLTPNSSDAEMRWRHYLCPREVPWLREYRLEGQIVFPVAAFVSAAVEGAVQAVRNAAPVQYIEIRDMTIPKALIFDDEDANMEMIFSLSGIERIDGQRVSAHFNFSAATQEQTEALETCASGEILVYLGEPSPTVLPLREPQELYLMPVKAEDFYSALETLDYGLSGRFVALSGLRRKLGMSTGQIAAVEQSRYLVHPSTLDAAFQSVLLAKSSPNDGAVGGVVVPSKISRVRVNPRLCEASKAVNQNFLFDCWLKEDPETAAAAFSLMAPSALAGDVDVFPHGVNNAMMQLEGVTCVPFSTPAASEDKAPFSKMVWTAAAPDASVGVVDGTVTPEEYRLACILERIAYFYLRTLQRDVPAIHRSRTKGPYVAFFKYAAHVQSQVAGGKLPFWQSEWDNDTTDIIDAISKPFADVIDVQILHTMGRNAAAIVKGDMSVVKIGKMRQMLTDYHEKGLGFPDFQKHLAGLVKQLFLRSPHVDVLEIGAGAGSSTKTILEEAGNIACTSYTYTDISSGFLNTTTASVSSPSVSTPTINSPMIASPIERTDFRALDVNKIQGFKENSYDIIVASFALHATPSLHQTLQSVRRLLRPGGHLIALEAVSDVPARIGASFGVFPGWWLGAADGRSLSPCPPLSTWDKLLRETGFSGCDSTTPDLGANAFVKPLTIFISQAVDPRVSFLRDPLGTTTSPIFKNNELMRRSMDQVVLLGGANPKTWKLTVQLQSLLRPFCNGITTVHKLADLQHLKIAPNTAVLSLLDLDQPVFKNLGNAQWEALKRMLATAKTLLWVTSGRRADEPYANIMPGLVRAAAYEVPGLDVQFFDVEDEARLESRTLAEALLRFRATANWKVEELVGPKTSLLAEREIVLEKSGRTVVPRLMLDDAMNNRYNSARRPLFEHAEPSHQEAIVMFRSLDDGAYYMRRSPVAAPSPFTLGVDVTHSLVASIRAAGSGYLFLALGRARKNKERVVAFSTANASVIATSTHVRIPSSIPAGSESQFLCLVAAHLAAEEALRGVRPGDSVMVHEPEGHLKTIFGEKAQEKRITLKFTSVRPGNAHCTVIQPNAPQRVLRRLIPEDVSLFLDLSSLVAGESRLPSVNIADGLRSALPAYVRTENFQSIFGTVSRQPLAEHAAANQAGLERAVAEAKLDFLASTKLDVRYRVHGAHDLSEITEGLAPQSVVDWTIGEPIPTMVQPVDSSNLFDDNKTYWLVGMSGSLGLSLCEWMVRHGARNLVISSRTPVIGESWLRRLADAGATIEVHSSDVTKEDEVVALYQGISSRLPPLGGVAYGAMVFEEAPLADMSLDKFNKIIAPKVDGAGHLSAVLKDAPLDFFIFFSSMIAVSGSPNHAALCAGNAFMASLAEQRRRQGLAACVVHTGPIMGMGRMVGREREPPSSAELMGKWVRCSEQDLHQQFAEAVLAGRPGSHHAVEITLGLRQAKPTDDVEAIWAHNPVMGHYVLPRSTLDPTSQTPALTPWRRSVNGNTGRFELPWSPTMPVRINSNRKFSVTGIAGLPGLGATPAIPRIDTSSPGLGGGPLTTPLWGVLRRHSISLQ